MWGCCTDGASLLAEDHNLFSPSLSFSCRKRRHWHCWQTHNEYIKQMSGPSCSPDLLFSISFWKMQESQLHSHYLNASTWMQTTPMLKMTLIQSYSWYPFNASLMPYKVPKTNANGPKALWGWDLMYWFLTLHCLRAKLNPACKNPSVISSHPATNRIFKEWFMIPFILHTSKWSMKIAKYFKLTSEQFPNIWKHLHLHHPHTRDSKFLSKKN